MGARWNSRRILTARGNMQDGAVVRRDGALMRLVLGVLRAQHATTSRVNIAGKHLPKLILATAQH